MRLNWTNIAVVFMPTLLALALRVRGLSDKPLWLDEVITQKRALLPLPELIANSFLNKHLPTYFVLLRSFDAPIINEAMLRLPSVVFGCVAVVLVALIATEIRSPRAGLVAGTLMALSPFEVQFSQEARPYTLLSCLVLLSVWGLVRIAKQSEINSPPGRQRGVRAAWIAYTAGTIAALNVLLVAAFWLLASNLSMAVIIMRAGAMRTKMIRHWIVVQIIIVLAWLPGLIAIALAAGEDPLRGHRWIPPSTWQHVWSVLSAVYLFRASNITTFEFLPTLVPWFGAVVVSLAMFGTWQLKAETKLLGIIGLAAITMPVAMLVISLFQPFWIPRYLIWSTGPLFVLAGLGAAALLPPRFFPLAACALTVAGIVNLTPYYRSETKPRWDLAAAHLAANARPGDIFVVNSSTAKYVLAAYGDRYRFDRPILDGYDVAKAADRLPPSGRVWVVYGRVGQGIVIPEDAYLKKWSAFGAPASTVRFGRYVVALRFDRAGKLPRSPDN